MGGAKQRRHSSPNGVRIFVLALALTVVLLVVVVAIATYSLDLGDPRERTSDSGYQNWAVIASFVIGTAAAVAVAWATVRLAQSATEAASEALEIARKQERREQLVYLETRVDPLADRFWEISIAISEYVRSTIPIYLMFHELPKTPTPPYVALSESEFAEFAHAAQERLALASAGAEGLRKALKAMSRDVTGRRMAQDVLRHGRPGGLKDTVETLSSANLLEPGLETLAADDLAELENVLALRASEIAQADVQTLLACQVAATNMSVGNAALSGLLFAGNLLWLQQSQSVFVSLGTALLGDLQHILPVDRDAMADVIIRSYPGFAERTDVSDRLPTGRLFDLGVSLERGFAAYNDEPGRGIFPPLNSVKPS